MLGAGGVVARLGGRLSVDNEIVPFAAVTDAWARQDAAPAAGRTVLTL
ncbi:hypothetical protein AB0B85_22560 [Micromonospora sp. NPDC049044]